MSLTNNSSLNILLQASGNRYPLDEIHYSDIVTFRECPAKFGYKAADSTSFVTNNAMILGSMFHKAIEHAIIDNSRDSVITSDSQWYKNAGDTEYWKSVIDGIMFIDSERKHEATESDINGWVSKFVTKDLFLGKDLREIVKDTYNFINVTGHRIIQSELRLKYEDLYGQHVGTLDLLLQDKNDNLVIGDIKTSGLWNKLLKGSSYMKQSMSTEQVRHHPQMKHYHWLGWRAGYFEKDDVKAYCILYPANLVPYKDGKRKVRGLPITLAPCVEGGVHRYQEDLYQWLQMIQCGVNVRTYPNVYGKIECPRCPWKDECLSDQSSTQVPNYLRG
tara:strand:- start:4278 stop:5273 length:996 start_codon:yes stop_codon:yes gene_type:complete